MFEDTGGDKEEEIPVCVLGAETAFCTIRGGLLWITLGRSKSIQQTDRVEASREMEIAVLSGNGVRKC